MEDQFKNRKVSLLTSERLLINSVFDELQANYVAYLGLCREDFNLEEKEYEVLIRDLSEFIPLYVESGKSMPYFFIPSFLQSFKILLNKVKNSYSAKAIQVRLILEKVIRIFSSINARMYSELIAEG